tara:strand:- start:730 stop:906 length:177 start_codon:yes stop_codon:yes gene_type:complete
MHGRMCQRVNQDNAARQAVEWGQTPVSFRQGQVGSDGGGEQETKTEHALPLPHRFSVV